MIHSQVTGRGTNLNPPNRFEYFSFEKDFEEEIEKPDKSVYFEDHCKTILTFNKSPDIQFNVSLNPYRGCEHGCIYCYARPSHEYLELSLGKDFETKIYVKKKAPALLKQELSLPKWVPQPIFFSGITDPYQPAERSFKITRACLEVCLEFQNPVVIITKSHLILRDRDILQEMAKKNLVTVLISVTSLERELWKVMEPRSSSPLLRIRTIESLSEIGISVGVNIAPLIPGLNEHEVCKILETTKLAGAKHANYMFLRLPFQVKDLFTEWLEKNYPLRKSKIINLIKEMRDGNLNDSDFFSRFNPKGAYAQQVNSVFEINYKKLGFKKFPPLNTKDFRPRQMSLL